MGDEAQGASSKKAEVQGASSKRGGSRWDSDGEVDTELTLLVTSYKVPRPIWFNNSNNNAQSQEADIQRSLNEEEPNKAVLIPEIVQYLMMKLDLKSLKSSRLVCSLWSDMGSKVISKKFQLDFSMLKIAQVTRTLNIESSYSNTALANKHFTAPEEFLSPRQSQQENVENPSVGDIPETVLNLALETMDYKSLITARTYGQDFCRMATQILVNKSSEQMTHPGFPGHKPFQAFKLYFIETFTLNPSLLTSFSIHSCLLESSVDIFNEFGIHIKDLKLTFLNLNLSHLQSVLLNWCPNLESLRLDQDKGIPMKEPAPNMLETFTKSILDNGLKLLNIQYNFKYDSNSLISVLLAIAKASKGLKSLHGKFPGLDNYFSKIVHTPQDTPSPVVFPNLESSSMIFSDPDPQGDLKRGLSCLAFGADFKHLKFNTLALRSNEEFSEVMENASKTLETLEIHTIYRYRKQYRWDMLKLPCQMEKLKVLKIQKFVSSWIDSFDFLTQMPLLEEFVVENYYFESEHVPGSTTKFDDMIKKSPQLRSSTRPNLKMKILKIMGALNKLSSLEFLTYFPKVETFHVELGSGEWTADQGTDKKGKKDKTPEQWNLIAVDKIFKKLWFLKNLSIKFTVSSCISDLMEPFSFMLHSHLQRLTCMEVLSFDSGLYGAGNMTTVLHPYFGEAITQSRDIRLVKLRGYSVFQEDMKEFAKRFVDRGIQLDFERNGSPGGFL